MQTVTTLQLVQNAVKIYLIILIAMNTTSKSEKYTIL